MAKYFRLVFILVNLFLGTFYLDIQNNGNSTSRMLAVRSIVENNTWELGEKHAVIDDKSLVNGKYYSDKAPLPTLLVVPVYKLFLSCGYSGNDLEKEQLIYRLGSIICSVLPFLFILIILFKVVETSLTLCISPVIFSMLILYGSYIFIYQSVYYNHLLSAALLLFAYFSLNKKRYIEAGLLCGAAFLSEFILAIAIAIWAVQLVLKEKRLRPFLLFASGILPFVLYILYYNYSIGGSPFIMLYKYHTAKELSENYGFRMPGAEIFWGLTFSDYKGIFFYAPLLFLFLLYGIRDIFRKYITINKTLLLNYKVSAGLSLSLATAAYFGWWGGWAYGPRLLIVPAIFFTYIAFEYFAKNKLSAPLFYIFCGFGFVCTSLAKVSVQYSIPTGIWHPFNDFIFPSILKEDFNKGNILTQCFGVSPLVAAICWPLLFIFAMVFLSFLFERYKSQKPAFS